RLSIAKHGVNFTQSLDAAGSIDLVDCQGCAESTLLAGVRQRASDWMQHTEFHRSALCAQHGRHCDAAGCHSSDAECRRSEEPTAIERILLVRHDDFPWFSAGVCPSVVQGP